MSRVSCTPSSTSVANSGSFGAVIDQAFFEAELAKTMRTSSTS